MSTNNTNTTQAGSEANAPSGAAEAAVATALGASLSFSSAQFNASDFVGQVQSALNRIARYRSEN